MQPAAHPAGDGRHPVEHEGSVVARLRPKIDKHMRLVARCEAGLY